MIAGCLPSGKSGQAAFTREQRSARALFAASRIA